MESDSKASKGRAGRLKRSQEEIERIISDFRASGLSQTAYAQQTGLSQATLSGWILRQQGRKSQAKATKKKPGPYSPEERRQSVETYLKSGTSLEQFGRVWGISSKTLAKWVQLYQEQGPQSLEPGTYGKGAKRGRARTPQPVREQIADLKRGNPDFGLKKIKNFLWRFGGVKVSTGTVRKTLKEENLPNAQVLRRKKPKRHKQVRRFERAKPMQLWQSDITSYVLTRHGQRVYLVVFMDDCSRYVVGWTLGYKQTTEFVVEALQEGISRFGKPEEVLTDQGRQYFSWRGKSEFQKLLDKQGIRHVVSRTHHPQTLGKCERFWETVGEEFWHRIKPQELAEAKERFKHFIAHYNHFRPHQGIDGMTPADRFFGLESEVRKAIEAGLAKNELRLALGEAPRAPVFLIGQIGDQPLSLHGEGGRLVLQTPDGKTQTIESSHYGHMAQTPAGDMNDGHGKEADATGAGTSGESDQDAPSPALDGAQEGVAQVADQAGDPSEGLVGNGNAGTEGEGAQNGSCIDAILAGKDDQAGADKGVEYPAVANLAVIPAGSLGYGSGVTRPTEVAENHWGNDGSAGRPESTESEDRGTRASDRSSEQADLHHAGNAGSTDQGGSSHGTAGERPFKGICGSEHGPEQGSQEWQQGQGSTQGEGQSSNTDGDSNGSSQ